MFLSGVLEALGGSKIMLLDAPHTLLRLPAKDMPIQSKQNDLIRSVFFSNPKTIKDQS